jgi:hypothetical protein
MTCGKGTETSDLVCPPASHPRAIGPNAVGVGKVDFSGGISQKPVPANFRMPDDPLGIPNRARTPLQTTSGQVRPTLE